MTRRGLAVGALALALACGRREAAPAPPVVAARAADAGAVDAGAVDADDPRTVRIPDDTRELVVAVVPGWDAATASVRRWRRAPGAPWRPVGAAWPAVIGVAGAAWGRGLHGDGAPAGRAGPIKREGDRKSPAGVFALAGAYGRAAAPPAGTRMPYTATTDRWRCVDDPRSRRYTQLFDDTGQPRDWASAEDLRTRGPWYRWLVDVRHNPAAVADGGSCIFLHVWAGPDDATVGCTAMAEPDLTRLIAGLDPAARPLYVLLPVAEYAALADGWGLPPAP